MWINVIFDEHLNCGLDKNLENDINLSWEVEVLSKVKHTFFFFFVFYTLTDENSLYTDKKNII